MGDLRPFLLWEASKKNPADRPSRVCKSPKPKNVSDPDGLAADAASRHLSFTNQIVIRVFVFLHLFSGRRREGDVQHWIQKLTADLNFYTVVLSLDIVNGPSFDLLDDTVFSALRFLCWTGRVEGRARVRLH